MTKIQYCTNMTLTDLQYKKFIWVLILFLSTHIEIRLHSEHWNSLIDGLCYIFTNWNDEKTWGILYQWSLVSTIILSIPFLIFKNKIVSIVIFVFMIFHLIAFAPLNYIANPGGAENFF